MCGCIGLSDLSAIEAKAYGLARPKSPKFDLNVNY